jgi:type I restriction-modification system DNA methylase subunit
MNRKNDIIKMIECMSGKYSAYEIFTDWTRCSAIAISNALDVNHREVWRKREDLYLNTIGKYSAKETRTFSDMLCMLAETLEHEMVDVLGQIYMEAGMGSKASGQFFTPYHISALTADICGILPDNDGIYRINEPSCGGGGMIIAFASSLKKQGISYQTKMRVIAQDLDWKGVYMCYLQLSLLGINAVVAQGDTLSDPYHKGYPPERMMYTPMNMGVFI